MDQKLDDRESCRRLDPSAMLKMLSRFPADLEAALDIAQQVELSQGAASSNILVCGMGGSAVGGDILRAYLGNELRLPLEVSRGYTVPSHVGPDSLVFVSSYSGNTEETLSSYEQAREAQARIVCITSGGILAEKAFQYGHPCALLPSGRPPRTMFAYSTVAMLSVLSRLGIIDDPRSELNRITENSQDRVSLYGPETPTAENPAKQLAVHLQGKLPVVYGSVGKSQFVAARWTAQFAENSKQLGYASTLPEMNHNEIVGWQNPGSVLTSMIAIFLTDSDDDPAVQRRFEATQELIGARAETLAYSGYGSSWRERLWDLILLGDHASIYLAFLNNEDPTPVAVIEALKKRLSDSNSVT